VLILRFTCISPQKGVEIGSTSGMRVQPFGPSSVEMEQEFPDHLAVHLQMVSAACRF
jgi:hypothetical protein